MSTDKNGEAPRWAITGSIPIDEVPNLLRDGHRSKYEALLDAVIEASERGHASLVKISPRELSSFRALVYRRGWLVRVRPNDSGVSIWVVRRG